MSDPDKHRERKGEYAKYDAKALLLMLVFGCTVFPSLIALLGRCGVYARLGARDSALSGIRMAVLGAAMLSIGAVLVEVTVILWVFVASIFVPRSVVEKWLSSGHGGSPPDRMGQLYGRAHRPIVDFAFRWRRSKTDRLSKKDDPQ